MSSPKKNKTEKRLETLAVKTKDQKKAFLEQLPKYPIVQVACEKSGVGRSTYYAWRKSDQAFAKLADEAIESGTHFINDMAESKLISNIQKGENTAIIYWLKNHHSNYNERIRHEHEHTIELEDEDKKAIAKALLNIGLDNILKDYDIDPVEWRKRQEQEALEHKRRVENYTSVDEKKKEEETEEELPPRPQVIAMPSAPLKPATQLERKPIKMKDRKGVNVNEWLKNRKRPDAL